MGLFLSRKPRVPLAACLWLLIRAVTGGDVFLSFLIPSAYNYTLYFTPKRYNTVNFYFILKAIDLFGFETSTGTDNINKSIKGLYSVSSEAGFCHYLFFVRICFVCLFSDELRTCLFNLDVK